MEIRKTKPKELEVLLKMYEHARRFMATHGNASQWENNYPSPQLILDDITEGNSYVCTEQDQIMLLSIIKKGLIYLYAHLRWGLDQRLLLRSRPPHHFHRKCKRCSVLLPELGLGTMRQYPY